MSEKIIGILGGMGPEATADLYYRIIRATPAQRDQDHLRCIIYSNTKVPDRTAAILEVGPSPLPELIRAAKRLEEAGADFIAIPCNTAHYFLPDLQRELRIPVINMISLSAEKTKKKKQDVTKVAILATDGTLRSRLYHEAYADKGITVIEPPPEIQEMVMSAIYKDIKAGNLSEGKAFLKSVADSLINSGAEIIVCGCTEVSLVIKDGDLTVPVLDSLQVLAEACVDYALGKRKPQ